MTFLYLNSESMGTGEIELGKKLLLAFLEKLATSDVKVDLVGLVHGAIHLSTQDGKGLEALRKLEAKGAKIASCGTCLEHYGQSQNLKIGVVGTMDQTVQLMAKADRIIRI